MKKKLTKIQVALTIATSICSLVAFAVESVFDFRTENASAGHMLVAMNSQNIEDGKSDEIRAYRLVSAESNCDVSLFPGDTLVFKLFNDTEFRIHIIEELPSATSVKSWIGATDCYGNTANAVVVKDEYGIHADIQDFLNGRSYRVFSKDGVVSVYECDPNYVEKKCGTELIELGEQSSEEYCESSENSMLPDELSMVSASSASETYVDTLLVFDTAAQSWLSKHGTTMDSFAAVAVAKMNTAIANTGLDSSFRYRLAGTWGINGNGGTDLGAVLSACYERTRYNNVDWSQVAKKRDAIGADVVTVLVDIGNPTTSTVMTGIGYCPKTGNYSWSGWSECTYNCCAISYVANDHTMTHETGHNMGCGHADTKFVNSNEITPGPGVFDYSSGYHFTAGGTAYHSIMAYNYDGWGNKYNSCPYFSSPGHKYNGVAVGDSTHNNTKTLKSTFAKVASFRKLATSNFSISPPSLSFTSSSGNGSFSVTANSSWTVTKSDPWITLNTTSGSGNGTVSYSVLNNTSTKDRTGTITVNCGSEPPITHTVKQSGEAAMLSILPQTADFLNSSDEGSFSVEANYSWSVAKSDAWIILATTSGNGNGIVSYSVTENNGGQRTGTITVTSGTLTATHKVTQAAPPQLSLDPGVFNCSAESQQASFRVTSDSMWTVRTSATWIKLDTTKGNGNGTVTYTIDENTGDSRQGLIYVESGTVRHSHMVAQTRKEEVVFSAESATVPDVGGTGTFTVTIKATSYYVSVGLSDPKNWARWSSKSEKLALSEGVRYTITYTADRNPSYGEKRSIKIPITVNDTTYYFTITQGFGADTYRVSYDPGANGRGFASYNVKTHDVPLTLAGALFTRTDYTQKGWATTDGGAKAYDLGASYTRNEAITLYPYWEKDSSVVTTYTIRFSPGSYGEGADQTATKYKGVSLTLPGAIYTREGYEQTGWSTLRSGTTKAYNLDGSYTTDAGAYLYPYWTEKAPEQYDVGFYTPSAYKQPLCLSTTNIAYWAYAPQYVFEQGGGLVVNYCAANYSDSDATLVDKHISLWDVAGNRIEAEMESYPDVMPAGSGLLFPNRDYSSWLTSIAPGNYALRVYLDPYDKLNDPNDSNNEWQTWFAIKAEGITLNEALDCSSLYFTEDGSPAFVQTSESAVGGSCVQFGPQPTNSFSAVLWGYVTEPGALSFKWKAASSNYKGCMIFYVGGEMKSWKWGAESDWRDVTVNISEDDVSSGAVWVKWQLATYDADPSVLTAGWLDNIVWNPTGLKPTFTVDAAGTITGVELNGMTDIEIPSMVNGVAVRAIGSRVFEKTAVTSVSIPETVTNICESAFSNCASLGGITIPGSVKSIGKTAFYRCHKLKSIILEEGLEKIEEGAFYNCQGLTYVKIPESVSEIGSTPFGHNLHLMTIDVAKGNPRYGIVNYSLVDKSVMWLLQYPMGRKAQSYEVPDGIIGIDYASFNLATNLVEITLPATLQGIGNCAFLGCLNLATVKFLGNAPIIGGEQTFLNVASSCKALVSPQSSGWGVSIPGTWQGIGIEYSAALQTYSVAYDPGTYGTGSPVSEVKSYGIILPLKGAIFTRVGYLQTGWSTSDGGVKAYELGASYTANAAVTLYPYWEANTYSVAYELDGGTSEATSPSSAAYGTAFCVSAPTRDGYEFMGWMVTAGLDVSTARYGESADSLLTDIYNASQQCFNGTDVDVWFINLTPVADGSVTLTATWEPVADDSRDIGFYAPTSRGWEFPVCLSSTNINYLAYAPELEFVQFSDVFLSFCAVNWSTAGSVTLQSALLTITDENETVFSQGEPVLIKNLGAFGYAEVRNLSMRRYMSGITPGHYKLTLELDPNRLLVDPNLSNNITSIWFTVTAPADPIPELPSDATTADVRVALSDSADGRLAENISDVSTYSAYREWARGAKGADGNPAGVEAVKSSDKAWFSFAVDSPELIEKEIAGDDVKIEEFAMASDGGQFDFTVGITDVEIGDGATMARLRTIFGVEGATTLEDSAFSSDNLTLETAEPEHGKVKLTVKPPAPKTGEEDTSAAFFMRVKVND